MAIRLNDEQMKQRRTYHDIAEKLFGGLTAIDRQMWIDPSTSPKLTSAGLLGLSIPLVWGGAGENLIALGLACEELETYDTAAREILTAHTAMSGMALAGWGTAEQKARWLEPMARGERFCTVPLDLPDSGQIAPTVGFLARRCEEQGSVWYELEGRQTDVRLAAQADLFLVFAHLDDGSRLSAFLVSRQAPGVRVDGHSGQPASEGIPLYAELLLDGVRVSEEDRLGEEDGADAIASAVLNAGRLTIAAGAAGMIQRCIQTAVACIGERRARPGKEGRDQFSALLSGLFGRLETARRMWMEAAQAMQAGVVSGEAALARWYAASAALDSLVDAGQIVSSCREPNPAGQPDRRAA